MDSKVFWLVMLVGFAIVVFVVFLTNNDVWQERRNDLASFHNVNDDAPVTRPAARPMIPSAPVVAGVLSPSPSPIVPATVTQPQSVANSVAQPPSPIKPNESQPAAIVPAKANKLVETVSLNRPGVAYSPIDVFFRDYEAALAEINDESEPERQEQICREATQRIDEDLRSQTWEFNCVILKVETLADHLFNVSHQAPDEVDLVPDGWAVLDKAASIPLLQLANKQQIFKGDYIVYVGTPRFDTVLADSDSENRRGEYSNLTHEKKVRPLTATQIPDAKYFSCTIEIGGVPYSQTLHLTNVNVKFLKGAENVAKTNWQQQAQQQALARGRAQLSLPQQQVLAQAYPGSASAAIPGGTEVLNQYNNYYSSAHPYYLYPEWLDFYRIHHFHHAHEHEVDFARNAISASGTATVAKTQATAKQTPVTTQQRSASVASKPAVTQPPKQTQPKQ